MTSNASSRRASWLALALVFLALAVPSPRAQTITLPANWPSTDQMMMGFAWASGQDGATLSALGAGSGLNTYYLYRYMDLTFMSQAVATGAIGEMMGNAGSYGGSAKASVIMQLFLDGNFGNLTATQKIDWLLLKMNDPVHMANFFSLLNTFAPAVNAAGSPMIVLEPNVFGYILQGRFHFDTQPVAAYPGQVYANILDFPAQVQAGLLGSGNATLIAAAATFPNTVAGFARAMVFAVRTMMPTAVVAGHAATWSVYANGCSGSGSLNRDVNGLDVQATQGVVTWGDEDIELAAFSNVRFFRALYGWDSVTAAPLNAAYWPDVFAMEKGALDAGLVAYGPATMCGGQFCYGATKTGASTDAFFWDQARTDKWLAWARNLSQGLKKPLVALRIPAGNGTQNNTPFSFQDTFMDWLFSSGNWAAGGADLAHPRIMTFTAGNWEKFKSAGFIGLFTGRDGWPAAGTQYGPRGDAVNTGYETFGPMAGDGGWAIQQWLAKKGAAATTFAPIPVTFNEAEFATFTGFCEARSETQVKTGFVGNQVIDPVNPGQPTGIFDGGADVARPVTIGGGVPTDVIPNNSENLQLLPDYIKSNAMWLFANTGSDDAPTYVPIEGTAVAVDQIGLLNGRASAGVNGGQVNAANAGDITNYLQMVNPIGLTLDVNFGQVQGYSGWTDANKKAGVFPIEYQLYIFDNLGHFVNKAEGYLSEIDVIRYAQADAQDNLTLKLMLQFIPIDATGRHIGSGVYMLRGFFAEQSKDMCQQLKYEGTECKVDGSVPPLGPCMMLPMDALVSANCTAQLATYGVNDLMVDTIGKSWMKSVYQNSVVITKKFGYMRND